MMTIFRRRILGRGTQHPMNEPRAAHAFALNLPTVSRAKVVISYTQPDWELARELVAHVEDLVTRTHVYGVVDSLDFLKRGGRIGGAQALLGSLLSIKPVIQVRDGVVEPESKQRTRTRALEYLAAKALHAGRLERLALCAGVAPDADLLATRLAAADCATELVVSDLGPVIGAHAGPGTIGMCFQVAR